jgi:hypothetical protein
MSNTEQQVIEAIRLLRANLLWSKDFDLIREPLANLLELLMQLPTHQLDEAMDALTSEIIRQEPSEALSDELERWVRSVERSIQKVDAANNQNIFQKIFRRS